MLSIENIIKLHEIGFSPEQIENINGLKGFEPEPKQESDPNDPEPKNPEPKNPEPKDPEPKNPGYAELSEKLDAMIKVFQAAMVRGSEQPKEMGVDDILSVILSPSGEPLK